MFLYLIYSSTNSYYVLLNLVPQLTAENTETGGTLFKLYRYVPPQMVFEPFWSENGYRLWTFWSQIGYMFCLLVSNNRVYRFLPFWLEKGDIFKGQPGMKLGRENRIYILVSKRARVWHTPTTNFEDGTPPRVHTCQACSYYCDLFLRLHLRQFIVVVWHI